MTDTILDMQLKLADTLFPDQLMEGDIIKIDDEYFTIKEMMRNDEGFNISVLNDYEEQLDIFLFDDETVQLYVYVE
jgi:hypothetical protein